MDGTSRRSEMKQVGGAEMEQVGRAEMEPVKEQRWGK